MIVSQFIKQIRVSRDYLLEIDLNNDYEEFYQYSCGQIESSMQKKLAYQKAPLIGAS